MEEIIKILDENLVYYRHEAIYGRIDIYVYNKVVSGRCPYCGKISEKAHSTYDKRYLLLTIGDIKVRVILLNRKLFCLNEQCDHLTFAQSIIKKHDFVRRTERFAKEIKKLCNDNKPLAGCFS